MSTPTSGPSGQVAAVKSLGVIKRREASSNPLVSRQRPRARPPAGTVPRATQPAAPAPAPAVAAAVVKNEPEPDWQEFKLTTTKREILAGLRHHVMRLASKRTVNPMDGSDFTMPIRLHRRDPKAPLQGGKEAQAAAEAQAQGAKMDEADVAAAEERVKADAEKAARAEKIAPYGAAQKQKKQAFKKKTQQVFKANEADKKLRYEEYFPWFIEHKHGKGAVDRKSGV